MSLAGDIVRYSEEHGDAQAAEAERLRGDLWVAVIGLLLKYVRRAAGPRLDRESQRDLASQKSIDLMMRFDEGRWRPHDDGPARLTRFVQRVATNAVIDRLRVEVRDATPFDEALDSTPSPVLSIVPRPDRTARHDEFVAGFVACTSEFPARSRTMLLLRVFYDLPSTDIAHHPDVRTTSQAVDMALSRARTQMKKCMEGRGLETIDLPPGTFGALWVALHGERRPDVETTGSRTAT